MHRRICMIVAVLVFTSILLSSTVFGSEVIKLSLDEAIMYALENNESLRIQERQKMLSDKKSDLPDLRLTVNATPKMELGGFAPGSSLGSGVHIHGGKAILGGDLTADLRVNANLLESDSISSTVEFAFKRNLLGGATKGVGQDNQGALDSVKDKLVSDVMSAYISVLRNERQVELAKLDLDIKHMTVLALEARNEAIEKVELAEDQLETAAKTFEKAEKALAEAILTLKVHLGVPEGVQLELCSEMDMGSISLDLKEWLDLAMAGNQTIVAAMDAVERSKDKLRELDEGPGWNADLSAGMNPYRLGSSDKPNLYIQVTAHKVLDITSGIEIEEAKVALDAAELDLLKAKDSVMRQVENTYGRLVDAFDRLDNLYMQLDEATDELVISERKYEVGFISELDLLKAQYSVRTIENDIFSATCDVVLTNFELKRLCGVREY